MAIELKGVSPDGSVFGVWASTAQGVSAGQLGVVDAATLADERKFRSMAVDP